MTTRRDVAIAAAAVILAGLMWSGGTVLVRGLREVAPPAALSFCRCVLACAILLPFVTGDLRGQWGAIRANGLRLAAAGLTGVALFPLVFFTAVQNTAAVNIGLINATEPLLIAILGWIVLGHRLRGVQWGGFALALAGIAAIVSEGEIARLAQFQFHRGDVFMIAALFQWAVYAVVVQQLPADLKPTVILFMTFAWGAIFTAPFLLVEARVDPLIASANAFILIGYSAVFGALISFAFWNLGARTLTPTRAGFFLFLMPVFTIGLSVAFLGEVLHWFHLVGTAFIAAGIALATIPRVRVRHGQGA